MPFNTDDIDDLDVYDLAGLAGCASPDESDSPGGEFLDRVRTCFTRWAESGRISDPTDTDTIRRAGEGEYSSDRRERVAEAGDLYAWDHDDGAEMQGEDFLLLISRALDRIGVTLCKQLAEDYWSEEEDEETDDEWTEEEEEEEPEPVGVIPGLPWVTA